ncbi:MAG: GntR family transcriptional regulator / MocR family aminotransferase [Solirubrobacteraceae bacterium]|nr:GntR family transcriptional regulator / MocR family aminotransferase [Solirubrobacteraceae bacterium]
MDETSQPIELLLSVRRDGAGTLGSQIEDQLCCAIREGTLRPGARVPSTRDLARQLGVSRRIVVDAYAQLAAEGYLSLRQGARPRVSDAAAVASRPPAPAAPPAPAPRFDFRPGGPDVSMFPRTVWLQSLREALATMTDADMTYGDARGVQVLRVALGDYLGRVRGVVADPERVVVTCGYSQGLGLTCQALAGTGVRRIAIEDPGWPQQLPIFERAGLIPVPVKVDDDGIRVDDLDRLDVGAVILTPAHQHPTGAVLSGERRTQLLAWLRDRDAIAVEDDYDAEYRYDRAAVGSLQGRDPDRVVYAGSVSKTLAPALRIGWFVVPPRLLEAVAREKLLADYGNGRIEQYAFADFLTRGELDRHLRRMRVLYRTRRDALVETLAGALPEATVHGIAAGLHAMIQLAGGDDEHACAAEARRRGIEVETLSHYRLETTVAPPTLVLSYAQMPEASIRLGIGELAEAVRATRG